MLILASIPLPSPAEDCAAWPGEPEPLPRVTDRDAMRARWATLRVRELETTAQGLEQTAPVRAHGLWRRVLCLDPTSHAAVTGLTRTAPVALHRPLVVVRSGPTSTSDAWQSLSQPVRVRPVAPAPSPPPSRDTRGESFARALAEVASRVRAAQFEPALESAARAREAAAAAGSAADPARRAQLEVLAATAELALGRSDAAHASFRRALQADPGLRLDAASTSPKIRRAFERARQAQQGTGS